MMETRVPYEHYQQPPDFMFEVMARRSALITGDGRLDPFGPTPASAMYFDIPTQPEPRIAELVIEHRDGAPNIAEEPVVLSLGVYHADDQRWHLFPELVRIYERDDVMRAIEGIDHMRSLADAAQAANLHPTIDYANEATVLARGEMRGLLTAGDTGRQIVERASADPRYGIGSGDTVVIDDATDMYLASSLRLLDAPVQTKLGVVESSILARALEARFHGLLVYRPGGNVIRANAALLIAHADADNPDNWTPNDRIVTDDVWSRLAGVPQRLEAYEAAVSDFMPDVCAVAANWDPRL